MGLETGSFVSDLVSTNPVVGDDVAQGDDHIRLLKTLLKATLPGGSKAFYFPVCSAKTADFTILAAHMNTTFVVDTTAANVTATLPTLTSGDDGWTCSFLKSNTGTNPLFIVPASGTLQSGEVAALSKCRRCIPGHKSTAMWTGGAWYISRVPNVPIGTVLDNYLATVPVGYELAYSLALDSTNYPEHYKANANATTTPDMRGRASFGRDDMGGSAASRITNAVSGFVGTTLLAAGGSQLLDFLRSYLPNITLALTGATISPTDVYQRRGGSGVGVQGGFTQSVYPTSALVDTTPTIGGTTESINGGVTKVTPSILPPAIIMNKILVVE